MVEAWVASASGGTVTLEIDGVSPTGPSYESAVFDPQGGRYVLENGVILDVPPGAVAEPTTVGFCAAARALVQPLLDANVFVPQYFAAGVEAVPDGLTFATPVQITVPVAPRRSTDDVPFGVMVDVKHGSFRLSPTALEYDARASVIRTEIEHFSGWEWAFASAAVTQKYNCSDPKFRCRCESIDVRESSSDFEIADECYVNNYVLLIEFSECPGKPEETFTMRAREVPDVRITPAHPTATMCEPAVLLTAEGIHEAEPKVRPLLHLEWGTWEPAIVTILGTGEYTALAQPHASACRNRWSPKGGDCWTNVFARGSCGASGQVQFSVAGPAEIEIENPGTVSLNEPHQFRAVVRSADGTALSCAQVAWSVDDPTKAWISGDGGVLTGREAGQVRVRAKSVENPGAPTAEALVEIVGTGLQVRPDGPTSSSGPTTQDRRCPSTWTLGTSGRSR